MSARAKAFITFVGVAIITLLILTFLFGYDDQWIENLIAAVAAGIATGLFSYYMNRPSDNKSV